MVKGPTAQVASVIYCTSGDWRQIIYFNNIAVCFHLTILAENGYACRFLGWRGRHPVRGIGDRRTRTKDGLAVKGEDTRMALAICNAMLLGMNVLLWLATISVTTDVMKWYALLMDVYILDCACMMHWLIGNGNADLDCAWYYCCNDWLMNAID